MQKMLILSLFLGDIYELILCINIMDKLLQVMVDVHMMFPGIIKFQNYKNG